MKKSLLFTTLFLSFYVFRITSPAFAIEVLSYKSPSNYKERLAASYVAKIENQTASNYVLSKTDLNNDAIDEYIIKSKGCSQLTSCPHTIIAISNYQPLLLGTFQCHRILIDNKSLYGVRHLRIYKSSRNSYSYSTAKWAPFHSRYAYPKTEDKK